MSRCRWGVRLATLCSVITGLSAWAVLAAVPASAAVTTLYVGGTGCSDTGSGTQAQPFCTINKAAGVAVAGQTVLVAAGTYPEKVTVAHSGAPGAPVVISPAPGAAVTVTGAADGFALSGRAYVTISGFTVAGTTSYGISVSSSSNVVISGNTVTGSGHPASGQTAAGIYLSGTTASTVSGNVSDNNSGHGIYLTTTSSNDTVSYNEASGNAEGWRRNANGIDVVGTGNTVIGNVLHDNEDSGLQFYTGGNNNLATLNVSYNNGDHGIDDLNVTGGRIIGNTVYHNCTTGINVEGTSGSYLIENNISVDNAVYPAYQGISCKRRAGNIGIWDSAPASTTVDNNLVYLSKAGTMYVFGSPYASLSAMRTATGQEQHGIQADPHFASAATGNLALTEGSPAIDAADSAASGEQPADIAQVARQDDPYVADTGTGPRSDDDLGAYEYVSGTEPPATGGGSDGGSGGGGGAGGGNPVFVNQIATNYSTSTHTSGSITVWRPDGVAAGDLELLTVVLTGVTDTGAVTGGDDAGNTLAVARDVTDGAGDRLVVLYGVAHTGLLANDTITITFPSAASYRITGDEISGVTALDASAAASGSGNAYASGAITTAAAGEFVFGVSAIFSGTAPTWDSGWTAETTYSTGTSQVARAYRIPTSAGSFSASGTASGTWLALCVAFA